MKVYNLIEQLTEELGHLIVENENLKIQNKELLEALLRYRSCVNSLGCLETKDMDASTE